MEQCVAYRVELKFLDDGLAHVAVDVDIHDIDVGSVDYLAKLGIAYRESQSYGPSVLTLCLSIEVAGTESLLAHKLGCFLANALANLAVDADFFHDF